MKFDIPVNITVAASNEQRAVNDVFDFLKKAYNEFGPEHSITNWEYFEFITEECGNTGCGDNYSAKRECPCTGDQVGNNSSKGQ